MMAKRKRFSEKIELAAAVQIEAAAGEDQESSEPPTFRIEAYNGGELRTPLYIKRFGMGVIIDLAGLTNSPSITANMDHDASQRVGHVTDTQNDGQRLILAGVVSGTGPAAQEVVENSKRNYPWQASVEALPTTKLEEIRAGQTVNVNGQTFVGPVLVARKSRLYGVAFLARGADETTKVSIAASAAEPDEEIDMKFNEWITAMGFDSSELSPVQTASLQSKYDAEIEAAGTIQPTDIKAASAFDLDELKVAYAKHESAIEATAFEYAGKVETAKLSAIKAAAIGAAYGLKKEALDHEWSATQFEVAAIKAAYDFKAECLENSRPAGPAIHASNKDFSGEVIEAAACQSLGVNVEKDFSDEVLQNAHSNFRNLGLQELILVAASANGYQGRQKIRQDNLREVLGHAMPPAPIHASSNSTVSLSGILSNIANKMLLAGFMEEDNSWREIAEVKSVSDFKTVTSYRMLDEMEYEKLGPNGEIAHGKVGEETFTRSADTYAKMFALTRTMIINDDLGAFDDLRTRLGRGAARKFRRLFWETFVNNSTFFTAARSNYISGGTTNLGTDGVGLQTGITKYRKMKSGDKKQVGVGSLGAPTTLLVPPELEFAAEKLYVSGNLSTTQDDNIHRNKYRPVVVNELSDSDYTGYSATAWYLLGSMLKPVCVSFLNGQQNPTVESAEADFNTLGVQFRGYHDFGVDMSEYLSGVKSKGAA